MAETFLHSPSVLVPIMQMINDGIGLLLGLAPVAALDYRSFNIYTMIVSSILYFQRNTTGAALISSKYW